jgi:hypothetical protein
VYHRSDPETAPSPSEEKFCLQARAGDSTCCPFECDECVFFRLTGSTSQHELLQHQTLLDLIRRANLDAFWSRAPRTVRELGRMWFYADLKLGETLGFTMFPDPPGPFPTHCVTHYDGGCTLLLAFYTVQIWLADMRQHRNMPQPERHDLYTLTFIWRALAEVQLLRQPDRIMGTVRLRAPPQILNGSLAS